MFCPQCGKKVEESYQYCPSCGAQLTVLTKSSPDSPIPIESEPAPHPVKKKPMPLWFKLLIGLAVFLLIGVTAGILFTEKLVDVIDNQLEALRQEDISKAYYGYTSKDFQTATSLEQFRRFVGAYPVFLNNKSAHFTQRSIDNNISTLKGNLASTEYGNVPIEYKLIKEEGKWKVLSIRLLKPGKIQNAKSQSSNIEELIKIAQDQLEALQIKNLKKAYQDYTAKEFRDATSEEDFEDFIKRYPILMNYETVSFHKPNIRRGIGTLAAILHSEEKAAYVKYYFIHENQGWKIWSMRILSPAEAEAEDNQSQSSPHLAKTQSETSHEMTLETILLGSALDKEGLIKEPRTSFQDELKDLYVELEIKNGIKDSLINLSVQHLDSGSSILAKATIEENGDTLLMSVFTPPTSGWPKGHYKLIVTTSSGQNKVIDFDIE